MCQKTVVVRFRKLSEICHKYHLWQFYDTFLQASWYIFRKYFEQNSVRKLSIDIILTHLYHRMCVRNLSWSCRLQKSVIKLSELCHISVRNLSHSNICHNSVRKDLKLTVFWQIYVSLKWYQCVRIKSIDSFLTEFC